MNDKELADKVVALGVGEPTEAFGWEAYYIPDEGPLSASNFVRDWRVVGALMEKCQSVHAYWDDTGWCCDAVGAFHTNKMGKCDSPQVDEPRAITEACVEALNG